jgi:hypothetical protein
LTTEAHSLDREFLQIAVNREEFLKLRGRTLLPVISKKDNQHSELECTEKENVLREKSPFVQGVKL